MVQPPPRDNGFDPDRLVESLADGGDREEVFRQLYERYHRPVCACFARRGFSAEDCRDLMQETFLRLHRGIGSFRHGSRFETWLYEITANVWRNEIRNRSAQKRDRPEVQLGADPAAGDSVGAAAPEQIDHLLSKEQARLLRRELARMPPRMRRCLQLRLDQELKFREIAVLMQISIDTVKSQLAQAKQRIRECLGDYFDEAEGTA